MSVIAKSNYDQHYVCFMKGSPEKIEELSLRESIPKNYYDLLRSHTQKGKRVIALSYKYIEDFDEKKKEIYKREEFEHSVIFLGFLVLSNKLKDATTRSIKELKEGRSKLLILQDASFQSWRQETTPSQVWLSAENAASSPAMRSSSQTWKSSRLK